MVDLPLFNTAIPRPPELLDGTHAMAHDFKEGSGKRMTMQIGVRD